ncbi:phage antirepressor KilAC domain-containing protein [Halomonas sp. B23F22_10]|uniref:phage antirepressor KilAC domain-containing protein n=1 Tax=Halomonas sp. B23F22_10 TaxID=3459515 RepID=UPI00373F1686
MNDIIETGKPTMSSREIALLTGHRHDQVLRTARTLAEQGVTQSVETLYVHEQNGQKYPEHQMNKRDSLVLVARLSPEFTATVVDRWQELEQQVVKPALPDFTNPVEAARAWADEVESKLRAEAALEHAKPAVEFVERYVSADSGNKGFRQVAKLLQANEREFRAFLQDSRVMYRLGGEWMPYQQHIDADRFVVKTGVTDDGGHSYSQSKFTPKGVNWIAGLWAQHKIAGAA